MGQSERAIETPERIAEGAVDDLTAGAQTALGLVPAGSWSALVLVSVHDQLRLLGNHIAAFGLGEVED